MNAGADVTIICTPATIPAPADLARARQLLAEDGKLPKKQRCYDRVATLHEMADRDPELAAGLALGENEPLPESLRAYLLVKQAEKDPVHIELAPLNALQNRECKLYAAVEVGMAVANTNPELAERLYQIARPIYDAEMHDLAARRNIDQTNFTPEQRARVDDDYDIYRKIDGLGMVSDIALRTVALAGMLWKTADVDAMLAQLKEQCKNAFAHADGGTAVQLNQSLFDAAGRVSPEFVIKVLHANAEGEYKDIFQPEAQQQALASMATHDPAAALRLIHMFKAMTPPNTSSFEVAPYIMPLIRAMGPPTPSAALPLALSPEMDDDRRFEALLTATVYQPESEARNIMEHLAGEVEHWSLMNVAKANAIDPEFGKTIYAKHKHELEKESYHCITDRGLGQLVVRYDQQDMDTVSDHGTPVEELNTPTHNRLVYAYLIGSIDPVEARLIIESEFARVLALCPRDFPPEDSALLPLGDVRPRLAACAADDRHHQRPQHPPGLGIARPGAGPGWSGADRMSPREPSNHILNNGSCTISSCPARNGCRRRCFD